MSKKHQEAVVVLGAALLAQAAVKQVIGKEAAVLGLPVFAVAALAWVAGRMIA